MGICSERPKTKKGCVTPRVKVKLIFLAKKRPISTHKQSRSRRLPDNCRLLEEKGTHNDEDPSLGTENSDLLE
ncbi:hypothetical protein TNCV_805611 [Trichonephila clavipes]|nr:hypothetical protein TNCV_805611 [Trichonephila clavipes]